MSLTLLTILCTFLEVSVSGNRLKQSRRFSNDDSSNPLASAQFVTQSGLPVHVNELEGKVVALYFSAHWCGPCRQFTPALRNFYETLKSEGESFEIVFVSSDFSEDQFEEYFQNEHGSWLAVAYGSLGQNILNEHYEVRGIPTLIVVDSNGVSVVPDARNEVMHARSKDSMLSTFANWKTKVAGSQGQSPTESNLLASASLITKSGEAALANPLEGKVVALYFSAHWCGPCRRFTPMLRKFYENLKANDENLEIVFVSSDFSEDQFEEYFKNEHGDWLAVQYGSFEQEALSQRYQVQGIPTLIVIDGKGASVVPDARGDVAGAGSVSDMLSAFAGWKRKAATAEEPSSADVSPLASAPLVGKSGAASANALEDKLVAVYFSAHWCGPCRQFTPDLRRFYSILKEQGKNIEIVFVSSDASEDEFEEYFQNEHGDWLAVQYGSSEQEALKVQYQLEFIPTLLVLDSKGVAVVPDAGDDVAGAMSVSSILSVFDNWTKKAGIVEEPQADLHPGSQVEICGLDGQGGTCEKWLDQLGEWQVRLDSGSVIGVKPENLVAKPENLNPVDDGPSSPLASAPLVAKTGLPVTASALEGKLVALYFSAHWCPPCRQFTPALRRFYETLKSEGENFEIVFISGDRSNDEFEGYFQEEHGDWLALQYGSLEQDFSEFYQVQAIPTLIVVDCEGKSVTPNARVDVARAQSRDEIMSTFAEWKNAVSDDCCRTCECCS